MRVQSLVKVTLSAFSDSPVTTSTGWVVVVHEDRGGQVSAADEAFRQTNTYEGPVFEAVRALESRPHTAISVGDVVTVRTHYVPLDAEASFGDLVDRQYRCEESGWSLLQESRTPTKLWLRNSLEDLKEVQSA